MADLTTVAAVKTRMGISGSAKDAVLAALVTHVSAELQRFCDRTFAAADYVDQFDADGTDVLVLRNRPINTVTDVRVDPLRLFPTSTIVDSTQYYVDLRRAMIRFVDVVPTWGVGAVKVTYNAGYVAIPDDVAKLTIDLIVYSYNQRQSWGNKHESLGGSSFAKAEEWPPALLDAAVNLRNLAASM